MTNFEPICIFTISSCLFCAHEKTYFLLEILRDIIYQGFAKKRIFLLNQMSSIKEIELIVINAIKISYMSLTVLLAPLHLILIYGILHIYIIIGISLLSLEMSD